MKDASVTFDVVWFFKWFCVKPRPNGAMIFLTLCDIFRLCRVVVVTESDTVS